MKKLFALFLSAFILLCFVGCNSNQITPSPTPTDAYYNTYADFKDTFLTKSKEDNNFTIYTSEKYAGYFYEIYDNNNHLLDKGFHDWRGSFDIITSK